MIGKSIVNKKFITHSLLKNYNNKLYILNVKPFYDNEIYHLFFFST